VAILICYSEGQPEAGRAVANHLISNGYFVFEAIGRALLDFERANATIVIWTPDSIESAWLKDQAERAAQNNKLIVLHTKDVGPWLIPKPHNGHPMLLADDYARILAAVRLFENPPEKKVVQGTTNQPVAPVPSPRKPRRKAAPKAEFNVTRSFSIPGYSLPLWRKLLITTRRATITSRRQNSALRTKTIFAKFET
jgi:hypothetical protein